MKKLVAVIISFFIATSHAHSAEDWKAADIKRIEDHLNGIKTLVSDFIQISPDGNASSGRFFLSRPGKLRWQYDPPVPLLIIANGSVMAYYDFELDTVSRVSTNSNIAGLLAREKIDLTGGDIVIKNLSHRDGSIRLTVIQKGEEDKGTFTFIFDNNPLALKKLEVIDSTKQLTAITLNNPKYGESLEKGLFEIDPSGKLPRKKN